MNISMIDYYMSQKKTFLEQCKECGVCAKKCPIVKNTALKDESPKSTQKKVKRFLQDGAADDTVFTRAFSCMECFKCVGDCCPEGLNPLAISEIVRWEYRKNGLVDAPSTDPSDPSDPDATQRVLASIQIESSDYHRILTETAPEQPEYVFFPGCNVYNQPEKILDALDILDRINPAYAFIPGLDNCCGDVHYFSGELEKASRATGALVEKIESYGCPKVVFWCPTCHCRFGAIFGEACEFSFQIQSFAQFVAENIASLPLKTLPPKTVTLHEACKSAFTGLDLTGPRDILNAIPGIELKEMERHGKKAVCCGSGAVAFFPESFQAKLEDRLAEAAETNTDILADVCHFCHQVFVFEEGRFGLDSVNYVSLLAEALGIVREDKFKTFARLADPEKILQQAKPYVDSSPFRKKTIEAAVKATFSRSNP